MGNQTAKVSPGCVETDAAREVCKELARVPPDKRATAAVLVQVYANGLRDGLRLYAVAM